MKIPVMLSLCGRQSYQDQEPDVIELITEGEMEYRDGGWDIRYEESDLTGLSGVTTVFRVEAGRVILRRSGNLVSEMIFEEGVSHTSLYQMEFGALMLTVCASRIFAQLGSQGGMIDLIYNIEIENTTAGTVDYHLEITAKE